MSSAEEEATPCKREAFLDDPITTSYGVGSDMVGLIECDCPNCRDEAH